MQAAGRLLRSLAGGDEGRVFVKLTLFDAHVDAHNILPDDASRADVQMPHLRIAHQAFAESDGRTAGEKRDECIILLKSVHYRCLRCSNRVPFLGCGSGDAPTIVNAVG